MLKNIIVLPDGTEVSSGSNHINAVQSVTLTQSVNNSEELTLGSACAAMLEAKLITPGGGLDIAAGTEIALYKQDDAGTRHKVGLFTLEKPIRPTAGTMKLVGYDRIIKLDKDLTEWLAGLTGWPYTLFAFAQMVCEACGLTLKNELLSNGDLLVERFRHDGVTGRQLLQWVGEIAGNFARATIDGEIELSAYRNTDITIRPIGDRYYFAGGLAYENYEIDQVEAVQLRTGTDDSYLKPKLPQGINSYTITGNPLLRYAEDKQEVLDTLCQQIPYGYRPCKVSMPVMLDIHPGDIVGVQDKNGVIFNLCVMTKVTSGQKMTLECTGSKRRDAPAVVNNKTVSQQAANNRVYIQAQAKQAVDAQTQEEVFLKLTNNGQAQGIFMGDDGELYINATYLKTGIIKGKNAYFDLDEGAFYSSGGNSKIEISNGDMRLHNTAGKLVVSLTDDSGGKVAVYDPNGNERFGICALSTGAMLSLYDVDLGRGVSRRVGFGTVGDTKTLVVY